MNNEWCTWKGLSFEMPSRGVIASDGKGNGCVMWAVGAHLRFELEECGFVQLVDLGLDAAPRGISVWEGKYFYQRGGFEHPEDGEMYPRGKFRRPTDEEWRAIRENRPPWPETSSSDVPLDESSMEQCNNLTVNNFRPMGD